MSYSISLDKVVTETKELYSINITSNVSAMAKKAGLYAALFDPSSIKAVYADDISGILEEGLKQLEAWPEIFKKVEAKNGWGTYKQFYKFVKSYHKACIETPDAKISVSQ